MATIGNHGHSVMDLQWLQALSANNEWNTSKYVWYIKFPVITRQKLVTMGFSMVISSPPPTMNKTPQNMSEPSISLLLPTKNWLLEATIGNHEHSVMDLQWSSAPLYQQWVKHLKICLIHEIPYYHPLNNRLLWVTVGNHRHSVMDLLWL